MRLTSLDPIVNLAKRRGFIFPSSEIYGGLASSYDYGPLGVELKNNVKKMWWRSMVQTRDDVVGLDAAILMHPKIWEASGHVEGFSDPLVDCKKCRKRWRADHLLEAKGMKPDFRPGEWQGEVKCPECAGELSDARQFNLMFKTFMGPVEEVAQSIYLRPETAQGIYVNFLNVLQTTRKRLPFGIAQIGKAFRNEITTENFTFRTREFEQMEQQFFVKPDSFTDTPITADGAHDSRLEGEARSRSKQAWFEYWQENRLEWYKSLGVKSDNLRWREHGPHELAHYAKEAFDIEYNYPGLGFKELAGIHDRGDWDLSRHEKFSGQELKYFDPDTGEKFIPHIIETSEGADRAVLAFLTDAYEEVEARSGEADAKHEQEVVLRLHKALAPIKAAILPLSKKEPLQELGRGIQLALSQHWMTQYDDTGSIGKRYRRQDEIGTPYCVTVDFASLEDKQVTVRDRDSMSQDRVEIEELKDYLTEKLS